MTSEKKPEERIMLFAGRSPFKISKKIDRPPVYQQGSGLGPLTICCQAVNFYRQ
jgi:hypothetical protein